MKSWETCNWLRHYQSAKVFPLVGEDLDFFVKGCTTNFVIIVGVWLVKTCTLMMCKQHYRWIWGMPPGNLEKLHPVSEIESEGIFSHDLSPFSNWVAADGAQNWLIKCTTGISARITMQLYSQLARYSVSESIFKKHIITCYHKCFYVMI